MPGLRGDLMSKKIKVQFNTSVSGVNYSYSAGSVVELPYKLAASYLKKGIVTPVDDDLTLESPEKPDPELEKSEGGPVETTADSESDSADSADETADSESESADLADNSTDAESDSEQEPEGEYPIHKGGGHYELSNGESIRGKEEALEAEEKLNESG